ncbi:MAG: GIY-YIG nuclease family protein [Elusimicrobia bacterium]|nr:GIY-YIG nuclease family protein [Elusimicrobiota bacterium]
MKKRKSRSGQLVCQHLENISSSALEEYQKIIRDFVRGRHGVYALYKKSKLYYVGLASNLRSRLKHHLRDKHRGFWDRFSVYLTIEDKHLKELETLAMRIASPKGNKQKGKFLKSEDLKRKFRKEIIKFNKIKLDELFSEKIRKIDKVIKVKTKKGRQSTLASYVKKGFVIRAYYKGKRHIARVRKDGSINFKHKIFISPSLAGALIVKHRYAVNGWFFWEFQRSPGEWIKLNELRK